MRPKPNRQARRPPMPRILDFETPEAYSDALNAAGYLAAHTEGVLTDSDGVLRSAHYRDGRLEFDDPTRTLSALYEQRRALRSDAADRLRAATNLNEQVYRHRDSRRV